MAYVIKSKYLNEEKGWGRLKKALLFFLVLILILISFLAGAYLSGKDQLLEEFAKNEAVYLGKVTGKYSQPKKGALAQDVNFNLFWDVWDSLKENYVDKKGLNDKKMFYGAIQGMVASLGDPYTVFMDPQEAQEFEESMSGTFEGIGAEIGIRDDILTIIAPLEGTPADKAGLKAGDKVYAINGESTAGININEAVKKIRGPKGSQVTLTISRDGMENSKDIIITRGVIKIKSVTTELKDNIFIIKISSFNDDTSSLFHEAVKKILAKNPDGIIVDLRNNPGGYLDTAIDLASEWIKDGVIVSEKFSENKKNDYYARGRAALSGYPTVVLVNEGSASASEILAGALRDHHKATIVGEKTFGKGSVQILKEFSDGSNAKITVAKWLTPNGICINDEGIKPDEEIALTLEDFKAGKDPQMEKALEILNNKKK